MARAGRPVHGQGEEFAPLPGRAAGGDQRRRVRLGKLSALEDEHAPTQGAGARRTKVLVVAETPVESLDEENQRLPPRNTLSDLPVGGPADEVDEPISRRGGPPCDELADRAKVNVRLRDDPGWEPRADLAPVAPPDASPHEALVLLRPDGDDEHQGPLRLVLLEVTADGSEPHPKVARRPGILALVAVEPADPRREKEGARGEDNRRPDRRFPPPLLAHAMPGHADRERNEGPQPQAREQQRRDRAVEEALVGIPETNVEAEHPRKGKQPHHRRTGERVGQEPATAHV
jgi:hypothetical protein